MIEINKINKYFGQIQVLNDCSLIIKDGDFVEIVGVKGAGKSALIKVIAGFMKPDRGYVLIDHKLPYKQMMHIGYLSKNINWYKNLSVEKNILLSAKKHEISTEEAQKITDKILEFTKLDSVKDVLAGDLSDEMKFKLSLAVVIVYKPLILLVEFPNDLDLSKTFKQELWALLEKINEHKITVIVATSSLDKIKKCKKVVLMDKGKILSVDSLHNLLHKVKNKDVSLKKFMPELASVE